MDVISKSIVTRYLEKLLEDETEIAEAAIDYQDAKSRIDVGLSRYQALRDFVTEKMGASPYATPEDWPDTTDHSQLGHFRFTGMKVRAAVLQVLSEQPYGDFGLPELIVILSEGGLGFPDPVQARAVNAALMGLVRSGDVVRGQREFSSDASYAYVEPMEAEQEPEEEEEGGDVKPDDSLPF